MGNKYSYNPFTGRLDGTSDVFPNGIDIADSIIDTRTNVVTSDKTYNLFSWFNSTKYSLRAYVITSVGVPTTELFSIYLNDTDLVDFVRNIGSGTYTINTQVLQRANGGVTTKGPVSGAVTIVTDTYIVLTTDQTVVCNKATNFTVTLPSTVPATGTTTGLMFEIKNINTGVVTVACNGADTIDGQATQKVYQWDCMQLKCSAANTWVVI